MSSKAIIIAEAGVNHNGSIELAYQLIDAAKNAGADYVKFQTFIPALLVSKEAKQAEYQTKNTGEKSQLEMLEELALSYEHFQALYDYCRSKEIGFLSTGFDEPSVKFIDSLGIDYHKIPSGEITNLPYLKLIGGLRKKILLSTGMATLTEVKSAVDILLSEGSNLDDIIVLQCTSEYPAPYNEVNLCAMSTMQKTLGVKVGFSDHTQGIEVPIAAVALGASVIEKHFTLNKNFPGPDHIASLEPDELKAMVNAIRNVEEALGNGMKTPSFSEQKNIEPVRRSIFTNKALLAGHVIKEDDLIMKRPGNGISPMRINQVIGKVVKCDIQENSMLKESDFS